VLLIEGGSDKRSRYVIGERIDCHPLVLGKLKEHFLNNGVLELVHAFHYIASYTLYILAGVESIFIFLEVRC